jgi:hypothetical protein
MGGAIRLSPIEDAIAVGELVVAEDLEEAASLGLLLRRPAWATATVANMGAGGGIKLPLKVRRVVLVAGGSDAARGAWFRLKLEGRSVQYASPGIGAAAFNEVVKHKNQGASP